MKTLITIGSESFLLPNSNDLAKTVELLRGLRMVRSETIYGGPSEDDRWRDEQGYRSGYVIQDRVEKLRVEVVDDADLVGRAEWEALRAATAAKIEERRKALPRAA